MTEVILFIIERTEITELRRWCLGIIPHFIYREEIKQVTSYRYLGIYLGNLLRWGYHVDYLCSHLQQRMYFLRRLRVLV